MACFLVSAAEAAVVTVVEKHVEKKEKERESEGSVKTASAIPLSTKLKWLSTMLWGGALLLLFEHICHGEVVPWFPFLTAMENSADMMEMFKEIDLQLLLITTPEKCSSVQPYCDLTYSVLLKVPSGNLINIVIYSELLTVLSESISM